MVGDPSVVDKGIKRKFVGGIFTRQFWLGMISGSIILLVVMFLVSFKHEEPKEDPVYKYLFAKADTGDISAVSTLYDRAKDSGVMFYQEHWAIEGALLGSKELRKEYVKLYKEMDNSSKQRSLEIVKENINRPGAKILLKELETAAREISQQ